MEQRGENGRLGRQRQLRGGRVHVSGARRCEWVVLRRGSSPPIYAPVTEPSGAIKLAL